ncbi:hypothetical protein [Methylobacterium gossipiicola]|uniref:Uncharacterized protein n=1 Tax=Methylobacterium gossipiicola TaxID=582675 RepID=A0A1I2TJ55_9HYPH|nr:hypothetical protein [Methylobacterium gossipiicola]SFG64944.1 hypothetical protein SAMN05192565_107148 [Methylobacterium gossipiicola]
MIIPGKGETRLDRIIQAIGEMATGGSNALGRADVVLAPGAAETVVTDSLCAPGALVTVAPLSASAAAAGIFLKSTARGAFVLGHTVSDATDRVLRYEIRRP